MSMIRIGALAAAIGVLLSCNAPPTEEEYDETRGGRIDVYFNEPGTRPDNLWEPDAHAVLIDLIDSAQVSIDIAAMGFSRQPVTDAVLRAYDRGVRVRMVGDAAHIYNSGYLQLEDRQIPISVGNQPHIMHDKFFVVDGRFVFAATSNITNSDLRQNINNFVLVDSPPIAADFTAEFEQMFNGKFGHTKVEIDNGRVYTIGDTTVEVWFTPNEDALGRILEYVDGADESIRFTIFAFTKDQVGSAFIRKQEEFERKNQEDGIPADADIDERRTVAGVIDQSQLHSNGQYHEAYRLLAAGIPMRMDGNDNSQHPGDYQAGGGRLHSKTMVIDAYGEEPVVISGSFNWSAAATQSNDEFLFILRGGRIARLYAEYFEKLWTNGRHLGNSFVGDDLPPGSLVINEVMWFGLHTDDPEGTDEFIELRNTTDQEIDLSMWQIVNENDFVVGLPPGSVVGPNETFLILDHTMEPYSDGTPQDEYAGYLAGDLVVNPYNDNRQSRLYIKDGALELALQDPHAVVMDRAGDGGPAFAGGPQGAVSRSMERRPNPGDGTLASSWYACTATQGGALVNPIYASELLATPDEPNSPPP